MKFSAKKMFKDGQIIELGGKWIAIFCAHLEAHDYGDTEPYMVAGLKTKITNGRIKINLDTSEGFIFPKEIPLKIREPLIKAINDALDKIEDFDLSDTYDKMSKNGTWPPPKSAWIKKGEEQC